VALSGNGHAWGAATTEIAIVAAARFEADGACYGREWDAVREDATDGDGC